MSEKRLMGRIVNKHDTEEHWLLATGFTPMAGEIIIYDVDANYDHERMKIGDGIRNVNELPFVDEAAIKNANTYTDDEISEALILSQADWSVSDEGHPAYIKNKTHGQRIQLVEVIPETIISVDSANTLINLPVPDTFTELVGGETYLVTVNGTEYECVAWNSYGQAGSYWIAVGNGYMTDRYLPQNDYPFLIGTLYGMPLFAANAVGQYTISVRSYDTVIEKLDNQYLSLWKPGEEVANGGWNFSSGEVDDLKQYGKVFSSFNKNNPYTVIWDGVTYECTSRAYTESDGRLYVGNPELAKATGQFSDYDDEASSEPFFIMIGNIDYTLETGDYVIAETAGYHSFVVYSTVGGEVQEIDDKYLPYYKDSIKNLQSNLKYARDDISTLQSCVSNTSLNLTDTVTGVLYTLNVQNGELVISRQSE